MPDMNKPKKSILPEASLWMGIASMCLCITPFSFILSFPAFVCGLISLLRKNEPKQRSHSLIGMSTGLFMIIAFNMLMPAMTASLWKSMQMQCRENLKLIGSALSSYSNDYGGEFPPYEGATGLNILLKKGYIKESSVFICPSKPTNPAIRGHDLTEKNLDYIYRPPLKHLGTSECDIPVIWDKPGTHKSIKSVSIIEAYRRFYFPEEYDDKLILGKKFILKNVLYKDAHVATFMGENWEKDAGIIADDDKLRINQPSGSVPSDKTLR